MNHMSSWEQDLQEEIATFDMLCGVGRKNIPVLQRHKVHEILIKSSVELKAGVKVRRERQYGISSVRSRDSISRTPIEVAL